MSTEFERVSRSAADSKVIHVATSAGTALVAAWQTSVLGRWLGAFRDAFASTPAPARLRWCATAIGVAAAGHLVVRAFMAATVAPAMPMVLFFAVTAMAALVAWQPAALLRAWHSSRTARAFESHSGR